MNPRKKFAFSLVAFVMLGLLSWQTLSDDPILMHDTAFGLEFNIRFRTATLVILGLWAAFTTLAFLRATMEERREAATKRD